MKKVLQNTPTSIQYITKGVVCVYKILSRTTLFIFTILFTMFVIDMIAVTKFLRIPFFTRLYYSKEDITSSLYKGFGYVIYIPKLKGPNKIDDCQECRYVYTIEVLGKEVYIHRPGVN